MDPSTFAFLISSNVLASTTYMVFVPFLPLEFAKFGFSESIFGYIYSVYSMAELLFTLVVVKVMQIMGRKNVLLWGVWLMAVCMMSFAALHYLTSTTLWITFMLILRSLLGVSSSMIFTSTFAIINVVFSKEKVKYLGYSEAAKGIGWAFGPAIGAFLYAFTGFQGTFLTISVLLLVTLFYLSIRMSNSVNMTDKLDEVHILVEEDSNKQKTASSSMQLIQPEVEILSWALIWNKLYFLTLVWGMLAYFTSWNYEPVLTLHLQNFNLSDLSIGLIFAIWPFMYFLMNLKISYFTKKFWSKKLISIGMLISGISYLLVGPTPPLPDSLCLIIVGLTIKGAMFIFFCTTVLPILITSGTQRFPGNKWKISDLSSGIFSFSLALGGFLGPISGSYMTQYFGFKNWMTMVGVLLISYSFIYYITWILYSNTPKSISDLPSRKISAKV